MGDPENSVEAAKAALRADVLTRRAARPDAERITAGEALCAVAMAEERVRAARRVALYLSLRSEPGTTPLLSALHAAGIETLLPVQRTDRCLDWVAWTGADALARGPHGITEPHGPRLGPDAWSEADVALVPGLLAGRDGNRLGRGAGYYDRSLALRRPGGLLAVVVFADEIVDSVPHLAHDAPFDLALTPGGFVQLGRR
ncbi:MAG TPA: 5-formyltetrahydrofolate cyclo-ligase [Sporichthyaceae bacterium]|nr:5-formyltetrahydrofolate cyclo-ligase [Sporichthyaceae bacterium]